LNHTNCLQEHSSRSTSAGEGLGREKRRGHEPLTREKSGEEIQRETEKINTFLDSGANIHVFKNKNIFSSLTHDSTRLQTACGGKENNTAQKGQIKNLFYSTGKPAHLHARGEGVVCENLKDNLISVGKMCDNGHTIIFHTGGYTIFEGEVVVQGEGVHAQGRDAKTGLYPLTLITHRPGEKNFGDCRPEGSTYPGGGRRTPKLNKNQNQNEEEQEEKLLTCHTHARMHNALRRIKSTQKRREEKEKESVCVWGGGVCHNHNPKLTHT